MNVINKYNNLFTDTNEIYKLIYDKKYNTLGRTTKSTYKEDKISH